MRGWSASAVSVSGISDIPMRLMIAAVITSLAIPVLWSAYDDISAGMTERMATDEITKVLDAVKDAMRGDIGSALEIDSDLTDWGSSNLDRLKIGGPITDEPTPEAYAVTYEIDGRGPYRIHLDPPIPMSLPDGTGGLVLTEGHYRLRIEHGQINGTHSAFISII